jgi:hypothetical protein
MRHFAMDGTTKTNGAAVADYFQEYLEALTRAQQFSISNIRHWDLIQCYAEFQFRLNGGSHCAICNAAVRHVIPVIAVRPNGHEDTWSCLCTRCYEGERATSGQIIMKIGETEISETPREYGRRASDYSHKPANAS